MVSLHLVTGMPAELIQTFQDSSTLRWKRTRYQVSEHRSALPQYLSDTVGIHNGHLSINAMPVVSDVDQHTRRRRRRHQPSVETFRNRMIRRIKRGLRRLWRGG
jgi:hypothetical protein